MISINNRFGLLTVIGVAGKAKDGHKKFMCQCDCGNKVIRQSNNLLLKNNTPSCGCAKSSNFKHGMRNSREYSSWKAAKSRCHCETDKDYYRYGALGIKVCDRWLNSFENFYQDMGVRPENTTLDRTNNSLGYEPSNCRWATIEQQANNRKDNVFVDIDGLKLTAKEFAIKQGINHSAAIQRIKRGRLNG